MELTKFTKPVQAYANAMTRICPNLSVEEIDFLCSRVKVTKLKANKFFLKAGDIQENVGFIYKGLLRSFCINQKGEEVTINFHKENNYVTDYSAFLTQKPSRYYIETLEPCTLINISFATLQECYSNYKNAERHGRLIAERHLTLRQKRIDSFLFENAEQRYTNFISENKDLLNRISITHLSSFLGVSRQTLTRIRKKIIQYNFDTNVSHKK